MQLTFILIVISGIFILIYSIRIEIKSSKNKRIAEFDFDSETKIIELDSEGLYALCFLGVAFADIQGEFNVELKSENGDLIKLNKTFPKYRFRENGELGLEYWNFEIYNKGKYTLTFKNTSDLILKKSILNLKGVFQNNIQSASLKILLKEAIPTKNRILSIVGFIIGINALIWGILIGLTNIFT